MTHYIITETRINSMSNPEVSVAGLLDNKEDAKAHFTFLVDEAVQDYGAELDYGITANIDTERGVAEFYNEEDPLMDYYAIEIHEID